MERDTSAEKDEFDRIQVENFAEQAEESIVALRNLYIEEAGEELRRNEDASGRVVNYFEDEATEYERERLKNQESFLSQESTQTKYSASTASDPDVEDLTALLNKVKKKERFYRKKQQSMMDWTASEEFKKIHELKTNNIALQGSSTKRRNRSIMSR